MLSIPPATITSPDPATIRSCASIVAFIADPHILLTVVHPTESGTPALIEACRAGAWPCPAGNTQPMMTSSTSGGATRPRSSAALIATAPRSLAETTAKSPSRPPIGVRAAPTMTIGSLSMEISGMFARAARSRPSLGLVEKLAADQHAANLGRSRADLVELRVAPQPPGRVVVDVAVAAEALDRLPCHPSRALAREEDRAGRVLARRLAAVAGPRDRVHVGASRVERRVHVGELALHQLERADRLIELDTLVHVREHDIETRDHDSERAAGEHCTLVVEAAHQHVDAAALLAQHVLHRYLAVGEDELAG